MIWIIQAVDVIIIFGGITLAVIQNDLVCLGIAVFGIMALMANFIVIYYKERLEMLKLLKEIIEDNRKILEEYGKNL